MDKYKKVMKPKETVVKNEEEIRVTAAGSVSAYISRAAKLFNEMEKKEIVIAATGNALTKAVTSAEVIKRRFKGLHQITKLGSQEIVDEYEPIEEGLDNVTETRNLPYIEIRLSKEGLDSGDKGYQAPIPESEVKEVDPEELAASRGRGRGRGGGRGKGKGKGKGKDKSASPGEGKGKGKGKGKGEEKGKGKGKGEGKGKGKGKGEEPKGKGKGKGKGDSKGDKGKGDSKGDKGKGKGDKGKGKGKSKGGGGGGWYDDWAPPVRSKGGKGDKGKGKGKWDDWSYGGGGGGYGGRNDWSYGGGSKGYGKDKGYGKGKKGGGGWY